MFAASKIAVGKGMALAVAAAWTAGTAHASFEVLLIPDFREGKIHRMDPFSGRYLGSFAEGFAAGVYGSVIDQAAGEIYFASSTNRRLWVFDYHTGEYRRDWTLPTGSLGYEMAWTATGNLAVASGGSAIHVFSKTGQVLRTINQTGATFLGIASNAYGELVAYDRAARRMRFYDATNGAPTFTANLADGFANITRIPGSDWSVYRRDDAASSLGAFNTLNGVSTAVTLAGAPTHLGNWNAVFGHGSLMYRAVTVDGASRIFLYSMADHTGGTFVRQYTVPGLGLAGQMSIVVAPEPGTLAVVGLGLAGLARRRRRRAKSAEVPPAPAQNGGSAV